MNNKRQQFTYVLDNGISYNGKCSLSDIELLNWWKRLWIKIRDNLA